MDKIQHRSDCALHNEPAMPAGPCDCGADLQLRIRDLELGMRTIAEMPLPQQDNMIAASMRSIAVSALSNSRIELLGSEPWPSDPKSTVS